MKIVFVGPSLGSALADVQAQHPDLGFRGPAARGDILRAVEDGASAIAIIDGYFGEMPSVWHKEILYALDRGLPVLGGASMGALRAAECSAFGMIGIGTIYEDYARGILLDDEAVALVHGPEALGWAPLSVPWVDFEPSIEGLYRAGHIAEGECHRIMLAGRALHFSERSYSRVLDIAMPEDPMRRKAVADLLRQTKVERKRADALAVIDAMAKLTQGVQEAGWSFASTSHFELLRAEIHAAQPPVTLQ